MTDLSNQVVVVTGAGTGIGQATALRFARAGATVIANGRRLEKLQETARLGERECGRIVPVAADAGTLEGARAVCDAACAAGVGLAILRDAAVDHVQ